jgi:AAA15 family ATPase/GTPase
MIQEFKTKNFRSFKDEVTLSFEATKDTTFENTQVVEVASGVRLLRLAIIYGANASGKSNLLDAFNFLRRFWFERHTDMDEPTGTIPFLLDKDTPGQPTEFSLKFYIGSIRYWYQLILDKHHVVLEKLFYYRTVQPTMLFSREFKDGQSVIKFNPVVIKVNDNVLDEITLKCLPNMSFFAARNMVNCSLEYVDEARDWMRRHALPLIDPRTIMFNYAGQKMLRDTDLKKYILNFIHRADFNITDVNVEKKAEPIPSEFRNILLNDDNISKEEKDKIQVNPVFNRINTNFEHTIKNSRGVEKYILPEELQSQGTRRTFGIEAAIYQAISNEEFLPIDEIESSLHPELIEFILEQFLKINNRSQLLVTTHYDPLLNTVDDLIRKDSVWFTEKREDGNSDLYSLTDFKGLNKIRSFQKSYRNGAFGALPNIQA